MLFPGDATGKDDIGPELNAFVNEKPHRSVELKCYGRYRSEEPIIIERPGVSFVGNESTLFARNVGDRGRCAIRVAPKGQGARIDRAHLGGTLPHGAGYDAKYEAQHGFDIQAPDVAITNSSAADVRGDFIYLNYRGKTVHVENFTGSRCGRTYISTVNAADFLIEQFAMDGAGRTCFDFEPLQPQQVTDGWTAQDGICGTHRLLWVAGYGNTASVVRNVNLLRIQDLGGSLSVDVKGRDINDVWTRENWTINDCSSDQTIGNADQGAFLFDTVRGIYVARVHQDCGVRRGMFMVKATNCADPVSVTANEGKEMVGQLLRV